MLEMEIDNSAMSRRVVRAVCDLARRPLTGLRVLDLACAHGHYALEMAKLGAEVVGIEGRSSWLEIARSSQQELGLTNVEFVQDDVRNLSKAKYGEFDIVLCLGILYHLDAPDVFEFLWNVADVCRDFTVIETHFATTPEQKVTWRGREYWGLSCFEHAPDTPPEEKLKNVGASLDNPQAFWITHPSLCNVLRHVGFTSVFDCRNPVANVRIGPNWESMIWGNRVTLAAFKGRPLALGTGPGTPQEDEVDWPESLDGLRFEDFVHQHELAKLAAAAGQSMERMLQVSPPPPLAAERVGQLEREVVRLQGLVNAYEQGRLMRLMGWLRKKGLPHF